MRIPAIKAMLLTTFFTSVCHAEIYKWTDERGQVHYSDSSEDLKSEKVEINPSAPKPDAGIEERRERQQRLLEALNEERIEKEQERAQAEQLIREAKIRCSELRKYQKRIQEANILYTRDKDGNREILNEESHQKEIVAVDEAIRKNCK